MTTNIITPCEAQSIIQDAQKAFITTKLPQLEIRKFMKPYANMLTDGVAAWMIAVRN